MQTAINPALAAAMTLEQAAQVGEFQPTTREGQPTVAAQLMQKAMPPSVPRVAQQAELAAQIQQQQMQQAERAMMQQAMQQAKPPGIEGLNPNIPGFANGGIVGYAGGTEEPIDSAIIAPEFGGGVDFIPRESEEEYRRRMEEERKAGLARFEEERKRNIARVINEGFTRGDIRFPNAAKQQAAPSDQARPPVQTRPAAPQIPGGGIASALFGKERDELGKVQTAVPTAEEVMARNARDNPVYRQFLISQGIDPDAITKRMAEDKALMEEQRNLLRRRMEREEAAASPTAQMAAALRSFYQPKGQGLGAALVGAERGLSQFVEAGEARRGQIEESMLKLNELEVTRRRALEDARRATAEGDWNRAAQALATERTAANEIQKLKATTYGKQATVAVQEQQVRESAAARTMDQQRVQQLYELRLRSLAGGKPPTDEQKMEAMEYAIQASKGSGTAARTAVAGQRLNLDQLRALQKTYADQAVDPMLPKAQRDQAAQMLKQVNDQIAQSAGITTAPAGAQPGTVLRFDERGNLIK